VRALLVALLVHGLAPGLAEVAEGVAHYAATGHAAHSPLDQGDLGDQGEEHGCGTTQHRCACCATQALAAPTRVILPALRSPRAHPPPPADAALAVRAPARPFRPPIA
jgi:hypothetical protein